MNQRTDPKALGRSGEDHATDWYQTHGYEVLDRNWRCEIGEIDIVAATDDTLVFVEVKSRASTRWGSPFEAVTPAKQQQVRRVARAWLAAHETRRRDLRFDAAGFISGRVEVIESAF